MSKISMVKGSGATGVSVSGFGLEEKNLPIITLPQIDHCPLLEEEGFLLPLEEGFAYLGQVNSGTKLSPGEIKISCGEGYIYLRQNGSIVINGVIITKEGKIIGG